MEVGGGQCGIIDSFEFDRKQYVLNGCLKRILGGVAFGCTLNLSFTHNKGVHKTPG